MPTGDWAGALGFLGNSEKFGQLRFALKPPPRSPSIGAIVAFRISDSEVFLHDVSFGPCFDATCALEGKI